MESVDRSFSCGVLSAWEENIWLDRRERACMSMMPAHRDGFWGRMVEAVGRFRARMQLGPLPGNDGFDDEPGKRI